MYTFDIFSIFIFIGLSGMATENMLFFLISLILNKDIKLIYLCTCSYPFETIHARHDHVQLSCIDQLSIEMPLKYNDDNG